MSVRYVLYADESGVHQSASCYTIGAILVPEEYAGDFQDSLNEVTQRHNISTEIKWEYVRNSYNSMNFAIDLLKLLITGPSVFTCIVVRKDAYRKWQGDQEAAFYITYTLLIEHCTKQLEAQVEATMDQKSESYPKHHEVVGIIANHKLKNNLGEVEQVVRGDSKEHIELQAVDILTGAVNSAHDLYLNPNARVNSGKRLLLDGLSAIVGWDSLHYDTFPNAEFNIWHFPKEEYRAVPATRAPVPDLSIPHITLTDIEQLK